MFKDIKFMEEIVTTVFNTKEIHKGDYVNVDYLTTIHVRGGMDNQILHTGNQKETIRGMVDKISDSILRVYDGHKSVTLETKDVINVKVYDFKLEEGRF